MTHAGGDPEALRTALRQMLGGFDKSAYSIASRRDLVPTPKGVLTEQLQLTGLDGSPVRAILAGPATPWRNQPAVVYCHAHGNRYDIGASELIAGRPALVDPPYGVPLAQAGFVSLCIDLPCFGERAVATEQATAKRHLWQGRTLFGTMLADLTGSIDVLAALPGVDPERIGTLGLSMGATLAFWLAALDPRIKAVAHLCCFADLQHLVESGAHDLHGLYMTVPGLVGRVRTGEIAGLVAPRPQLIAVGLLDPLTPPAAVEQGLADARRAYSTADGPAALEHFPAKWIPVRRRKCDQNKTLELRSDSLGSERALETHISATTGHVETPAMRAAVLDFLARTL